MPVTVSLGGEGLWLLSLMGLVRSLQGTGTWGQSGLLGALKGAGKEVGKLTGAGSAPPPAWEARALQAVPSEQDERKLN